MGYGVDSGERGPEKRGALAALDSIVEAAGRAEAKRRNLRVTGTLGVLRAGAEQGLVNVPELLERLRELMPGAIFLLPGVGAQGGAVEGLAAAFRRHPAGGPAQAG